MADTRFFKKSSSLKLGDIARQAGAQLAEPSDAGFGIEDVAPLDSAGASHLSFLDNIRYKDEFRNTKAGACIVSPKMAASAPKNVRLILSESPYKSYALAAQMFYPDTYPLANISPRAHVHASAKIGKGCIIEDGAVIGANAEIGEGCWIEPNAVIGEGVTMGKKSRIGANASVSHALVGETVRLYPGVRVGQDGFGFAIDPSGHVKVPQLGRVVIGDHVEIGANCCIDRGAGPDTVIGAGTWIDTLVQIR